MKNIISNGSISLKEPLQTRHCLGVVVSKSLEIAATVAPLSSCGFKLEAVKNERDSRFILQYQICQQMPHLHVFNIKYINL